MTICGINSLEAQMSLDVVLVVKRGMTLHIQIVNHGKLLLRYLTF